MKIVLTILSLAGTLGTCFAQGTVNWDSLPFPSINAQTNTTQYYTAGPSGGGTIGNTAPSSTGLIYYYELLYNTSFNGSQIASPDYTGLFNGTWLDTGLTATNSTSAGRLTPVNPNVDATVPWANGVTNNILLVGWSSNLGTDWATVSNELANWNTGGQPFLMSNAFFGESATGYLNSGSGLPAPGPSVFATGATANGLPINSPDMQLYAMPATLVVPEPTTIALAGFGGISLLLFRRKK